MTCKCVFVVPICEDREDHFRRLKEEDEKNSTDDSAGVQLMDSGEEVTNG